MNRWPNMAALGFVGDALLLGHDPSVRMSRARVSIEKYPELLGTDQQRMHGPDRPDGRCPVTGYLTGDLPNNISRAPQSLKHLLAITSNGTALNPSRYQNKHMSRRLTLHTQRCPAPNTRGLAAASKSSRSLPLSSPQKSDSCTLPLSSHRRSH